MRKFTDIGSTRVRISIPAVLAVYGVVHLGFGAGHDASVFAQPPAAAQTGPVYSPQQAAADADQLAEQRRRWAIERQLEVIDGIRQARAAAAFPYAVGPAMPGYPRAARRALRRGYAPPPPYPQPGHGVLVRPGPFPAAPYWGLAPHGPPVRQPLGHERIWTGPNSYIYRPLHPEPFQPAPVERERQPTVAEPRPRELPVPREAPAPPPQAVPEIPEPPPVLEPGPREF